MPERIKSYNEFYQHYLSEHKNKTSRILHFIGTFLVFILLFVAIFQSWDWKWILVPVVGYGFAWVGHAFLKRINPQHSNVLYGVCFPISDCFLKSSSEGNILIHKTINLWKIST